jgi:hypothetical protein
MRRSEVLLGTLTSRFQVSPVPANTATVSLDGKAICSIETPSLTTLKEQLIWVRNYADLRVDRIPEITVQTGDILSFFGSVSLLNTSRRKKTIELLSLVQALAIHLEMQVKHYSWSPRPIDFAHQVQPIIQTPDHSTFPSGHATEAHAIATVLHRLETGQSAADGIGGRTTAMPFRTAHRIAVNRTIAGVHFPVDSAAGAILGCMIGEAVHSAATTGPQLSLNYGAEAVLLGDKDDFTQAWLKEKYLPSSLANVDAESPLFKRLWDAAKDEWKREVGQ